MIFSFFIFLKKISFLTKFRTKHFLNEFINVNECFSWNVSYSFNFTFQRKIKSTQPVDMFLTQKKNVTFLCWFIVLNELLSCNYLMLQSINFMSVSFVLLLASSRTFLFHLKNREKNRPLSKQIYHLFFLSSFYYLDLTTHTHTFIKRNDKIVCYACTCTSTYMLPLKIKWDKR